MTDQSLDLTEVTVEFDEETLEQLDELAFRDHREHREAAVRELLDQWLKERATERGPGWTE
jgi:metal-responsive CopG/Arc/MetJ family transcriptional regulator